LGTLSADAAACDDSGRLLRQACPCELRVGQSL
jgi:hypothetical protein